MTKRPKIRLMLDSGAYSAWTHGKTIPIRDYIKFIKEVEDYCWIYVNLDVIPGHISRPRSAEEVAKSAKDSYRNLQIMKDAGLRPLPVFHQMESFSWLERMLKDGEDFIGISSAKNMLDEVQEAWLDDFFSVVTDSRGHPLIKVHAFGSAHVRIIKRHPYYSVDSAGWRIAAAYGKLYIPQYPNFHKGDRRPDYLRDPLLQTVTGGFHESPHGQLRQHENVGFTTKSHLELVRYWLEKECKLNLGLVRYSAEARNRALAVYYQRVSEQIKNVRFVTPFAFGMYPDRLAVKAALAEHKPVHPKHLNFIFSTSYDQDCCSALLAAKADMHLLSYWEIKNQPQVIADYVMYGKVNNGKKVKPKIDWKDRRYLKQRDLAMVKIMQELGREENVDTEITG